MKSMTRVILFVFVCSIGSLSYSVNNPLSLNIIRDADATFSYTFSIAGISTYADAKPFYKFIQETFSKRPNFNDTTGKFEITDSPILLSEIELTNRLNQIELTLTSYTLISPDNTVDHHENR